MPHTPEEVELVRKAVVLAFERGTKYTMRAVCITLNEEEGGELSGVDYDAITREVLGKASGD